MKTINVKFIFLTGLMTILSFSLLQAQTWSTASERLYANPTSTRVGIGTSNPSASYKLHVYGGFNSKDGIYAYAYGSGKRAIFGNNSHGSGYAGYFQGNLHSTGNITANINKVIKVGNSTSSLSMHAATCCPGAYMDYDGGPLVFRRAGVSWDAPLNLQANGTVVIGGSAIYDGSITNTNGHKLSVNGGIWCEEVEVTANVPSSDYVFYDDYKLMSLKEVEKFVKDNHHLPEVPSAEAFKKNGYKLGDMDDLLLRKVEELTLYTIAADKQIEKLTKEKENLLDKFAQLEARLAALEENKE